MIQVKIYRENKEVTMIGVDRGSLQCKMGALLADVDKERTLLLALLQNMRLEHLCGGKNGGVTFDGEEWLWLLAEEESKDVKKENAKG